MTLRTLAEKDGCYVHEDSCVEFFMQPFEGTDYINFEFNAAGICYAAHHMNDTASVKFTPEEFAQIKRHTKLAGQKIEEQEGPVFGNCRYRYMANDGVSARNYSAPITCKLLQMCRWHRISSLSELVSCRFA